MSETMRIITRLELLERLADQQLALNDQLLSVTARLGMEHALYQERLARHEETMAALRTIFAAITDLLDGPNGH